MPTSLPDPLVDPAFVLRVANLAHRKPTQFAVLPQPETVEALKASLRLSALRKVSLKGAVEPVGSKDFRLRATLGATVVQPCVLTLEPVTTRLDVPVERMYLSRFTLPEGEEAEMPEDDTLEPLPEEIDLIAVLHEALSLHLPSYPRSTAAEAGELVFTEPGKAAMTDADARPFAGLAGLKDKLQN
ncbi:YceD family protein [Pseudaestuariivita sp.]|uniref:YceD family protein n=1 Tax=Pseudaestuariivita sp. TaxID=2211669 RepID=UPI004058F7D8